MALEGTALMCMAGNAWSLEHAAATTPCQECHTARTTTIQVLIGETGSDLLVLASGFSTALYCSTVLLFGALRVSSACNLPPASSASEGVACISVQ